MRNGLYRVHFQTPRGMGAGVVYAQDGRMWGGDAGLFYAGTYSVENGRLSANVSTDRHTNIGGVVSVFGIDRVTIQLAGVVNGDSVTATGSAIQAPGVNFTATLSRVSD